MPENLIATEVAAYLRCSRETVENLIRSGHLRPVQIVPRGKRLFPKSQIEALLRGGQ